MRRALLVLLASAAAVAVLGWCEVIPLPFAPDARAPGPDVGSAGLGAPGGPGEEGATLTGHGGRPTVVPLAPPEPPVAAEVAGSVPHGGVVRGRVVFPGEPTVPVARATLRLARPHTITTFLRTPAEGRWDVLVARTGEDGRFVFRDVRPNAGYVVRARGGERGRASSAWFDLVERQVEDLGDLVLADVGALEGRVVDGAGAPLAGVRVATGPEALSVWNMTFPDPDLLAEKEAETLTDAQGRYRLAPLERGTKTVVAASAAHGATVRSSVEVGEATVLADIALGAAGVLAGRIEWEDGKPLAGARVFALDADSRNGTLFSTLSGPDGAFRLPHLEGDPLRVGAWFEGVMSLPQKAVPSGTLDLVLRLPVVGGLTGRVVRQADGRPVARFGVRLELQDPKEPFTTRFLRLTLDKVVGAATFAAADGTFRLPLLARGSYVVVVSAQGFPEARSARVEVPAGGVGDAGTIALIDGFGVGGVVRTTLGEPLAHAEVRLLAPTGKEGDGDAGADDFEDGAPDAFTDEEGRFLLPPQTPGTYGLFVRHPLALGHLEPGLDLKAGPRTDLELRLEPAGKVEVRVLDAAGKPARGEAVLLLRANEGARWDGTDAEGKAQFVSVPVGPCVVCWRHGEPRERLMAYVQADDDEARTRAYEALRTDLREEVVRAGQATAVTVRLPRRVHLTVRIEPWEPDLVVERVYASDPGRGSWFQVRDEETGALEADLPAGTYTFYAVPRTGGWEARKEFEGVVVPDVAAHTVELGR